ncbi:MAG: MFS transporter [Desulfobacteraceae bacterium]|nr:MAG: MFS transporter [Desulfobacteraceae bacterium]
MRQPAPAQDRRWWVVGAILMGTWVGTLGNSMVPVALPSMVEQLGVGVHKGIWLISVYVLMVAVLMPLFGWLGDRFGYRRIYLGGLVGFGVSSLLAGFATSFWMLVGLRVVQGICNATTLPSVMGIISQSVPGQERGKAMGLWAAVNGAAHGLGPVISGFLVHSLNWRAIFWVNGAMTVVGLAMVWVLVPRDQRNDRRVFDWVGAVAFTVAVLGLMLNLSLAARGGWTSAASLSLWVVFAALMGVFFVAERRVRHPFVRLSLFGNKAYSALVAMSGAQFFCLMGFQVLMPLYLIQLRGFSTPAAGLIIAALPASLALFSPFAGAIADRRSHAIAIRNGMLLVCLATAGAALWPPDLSVGLMMATLAAVGVGMGFTQSPAAAAVTLFVRKDERGVALGIFNMLRFVSATLGATIAGVLVVAPSSGRAVDFEPFRLAFLLLSALAGAAALLYVFVPREKCERMVE